MEKERVGEEGEKKVQMGIWFEFELNGHSPQLDNFWGI
jgi:hypothetical protein